MELFDTHVHLAAQELHDDLDGVLERARAAGVTEMLAVATDLGDAARTIEIARTREGVRAAVGVHPEAAGRVAPGWEDALDRLIAEARPVAVGECGLDGHHPEPPVDRQRPVFKAQLALARKHRLPVVIHSRKAGWECLKAIEEAGGVPAGGVFHCLEADEVLARAIVKAGFHIGIGGTATFPRNDVLRAMLKRLPPERLLLETDAPWLAPQPARGRRNEPAYVVHVAATAARAVGMGEDELAALTTANARRLFGGGA